MSALASRISGVLAGSRCITQTIVSTPSTSAAAMPAVGLSPRLAGDEDVAIGRPQ
jgi:hypothetical protein